MADIALNDLVPVQNGFLTNDIMLVQRGSEPMRVSAGDMERWMREEAQKAAGNLQRGYRGYGITEVTPQSAEHSKGGLDTYVIHYEDGHTSTYQVYNGMDGDGSPPVAADIPALAQKDGAVSPQGIVRFSAADHVHPSNVMMFSGTVASTAWVDDDTYADFPYKAVALHDSRITSACVAEVMFDYTEIESGIYAPITSTDDSGNVWIYAAAAPNTDIVIPSIVILR